MLIWDHMGRYGRIKPAKSLLLVCLLVLSQWTGLAMVLCVSGPDHIRYELLDPGCFGALSTPVDGTYMDAGGGCTGCTDIAIQTASDRTPSDQPQPGVAVHAVVLPRVVAPPAGFEDAIDLSAFPLPSPIPGESAPLRC